MPADPSSHGRKQGSIGRGSGVQRGAAGQDPALDRDSGHRVVSLLKRLGEERGTTTLMVTHDPRILDMADRVVTMEDGRIVGDR